MLFRYIPTARVQYEYPGQYKASDSQSCASDSNLLLHDDPDHYDDPYADPYEDKSDSQQGRCPAEEAELRNQEAAAAAADADSPAEEAELRNQEAAAASADGNDSPAEEAALRLQQTHDSCQDVRTQSEQNELERKVFGPGLLCLNTK